MDSVARERRYLAVFEAPPPRDVQAFVLHNIQARVPQFVALEEGQVVGWCDVLPKPQPGLRHTGVLGMGVVAAWRGRGMGSQLLRAALHAARQRAMTRIELTVRVDNERARRLYERFGFTAEGRCRRYLLVDGRYEDGYLMALLHGAE